ncbi:MAG: uracil-DNA glycosylase [Pseudomonadota bacterium]
MSAAPPDRSTVSSAHAEAILRWHADLGLDAVVGDAAVDRFALEADRKAERQQAVASKAPKPSSASSRPANAAARAADETPPAPSVDLSTLSTVEEVTAALEAYDGCTLKPGATNLCHYDGNPDARIALIGEAPGRDEDLQGKPFVGRAGQLLDLMFGAIGLDRTKVFITNMVFWRPPGNRDPSTAEIAACRPFLDRTIELIDPDIVILCGKSAAGTLLDTRQGITRLRGTWAEPMIGGETRRSIAMLHPAYLLRQPLQKKFAWQDMLALQKAIEELSDDA